MTSLHALWASETEHVLTRPVCGRLRFAGTGRGGASSARSSTPLCCGCCGCRCCCCALLRVGVLPLHLSMAWQPTTTVRRCVAVAPESLFPGLVPCPPYWSLHGALLPLHPSPTPTPASRSIYRLSVGRSLYLVRSCLLSRFRFRFRFRGLTCRCSCHSSIFSYFQNTQPVPRPPSEITLTFGVPPGGSFLHTGIDTKSNTAPCFS